VIFEGNVKVIRIEKGEKKQEICSHKVYVSEDLESRTKIITAFEQNGSRIKRFPQPEMNDANEVLLK